MPHPLGILLQHKTTALGNFSLGSPYYWELSERGYEQASRLLLKAAEIPNLNSDEHLCLNLWQLVTQYQFLCLELIVSLYLDAAFALMRNATELARDVAFIKDDLEARELWIDARMIGTPTARNRYRKSFRFNDSTEEFKRAHMFYDFASECGTHSHITALSFGKRINSVAEVIEPVNVSKRGLQDGVAMWIGSFCSLQILCAKHFIEKSPGAFGNYWKEFFELHNQMEGIFKVLAMDPNKSEYGDIFRRE